jgi:hypothetical protein
MKRQRPHPSTVPSSRPPKRKAGRPPQSTPHPRASHQHLPPRAPRPLAPKPVRPPKAAIARIIDESERSLVDVIDNLLNSGVMLNADIILALADVDLVYLRLSALLCAADRVFPASER